MPEYFKHQKIVAANMGDGRVTDDQFASPGLAGLGTMRCAHARFDFSVDGGAIGPITPVMTAVIPANAILIGATIDATTSVTSLGSATVAVGTTAGSSASAILAATAKASLAATDLLNGVPTLASPVKMSAAGSINVTVAAAVLTAGVLEIFVYYVVSGT